MTRNLDQLLGREEELEVALAETGRASRGQTDGREEPPPEVQEEVNIEEVNIKERKEDMIIKEDTEETEELEGIDEGEAMILREAERA